MDPMDLARVFVRTVARMFYETEHIVVIDALAFHGALSLNDVALVLEYGKQTKTAQKMCGRLREGGLVSIYTRQEVRDGANKASNREYYYIDYRRAIDATKYRIHMLDEKIKADSKPTQEKTEFICPRCKAQWTTMDVLDLVDPRGRGCGFLCKTCEFPLESIATSTAEPENDDTPAKFNRQFSPLLKLMQQIDQVTIPAIDPEDAIEGAIPLPRDNDINPAAKHEPVPQQHVRPTAVKGIVTAPEKIEISIATDKEYTEAARAAEKQRLDKIAAQNQLPAWHTKSTVSNKDYDFSGPASSAPATNGVAPAFVNNEPEEESKAGGSTLDDYFEQLEAEKRAEQEAQAAEEEEEDEDDDDEFEEVLATPAQTNGAPDAKRPKLEGSAAPSPANVATPVTVEPSPAGDREESDEDDEEFESVV